MKSLFPVIVTDQLNVARDFYTSYFGFSAVFEADWYIQLHAYRGESSPPIELAFMLPNLESQPKLLHSAFSGVGVILSMDVEEVDAVHAKLHDADVLKNVVIDLRDEPWGQRHFLFIDPIGTLVDVVQQIQPSPEYVDAYSQDP